MPNKKGKGKITARSQSHRKKKQRWNVSADVAFPGVKISGNASGRQRAPVAVGTKVQSSTARFRSHPNGTVLIQKELMQEVTHSDNFVTTGIPINPTLAALLPWASEIATQYTGFRFRKLTFLFIPNCASTTPGKVAMHHQPDVQDPDPEDFQNLMSYAVAAQSSAWMGFSIDLVQDAPRYTAGAGVVSSSGLSDPKTLSYGKFFFSTQGAGLADGEIIGSIFVKYELELTNPQPQSVECGLSLVSANVVDGTYADTSSLVYDPASLTTLYGPPVLSLSATDTFKINVKHEPPIGHSWYYHITARAYKGVGLTYTAGAPRAGYSNTGFAPGIDIAGTGGTTGAVVTPSFYGMASVWSTSSNWTQTVCQSILEVAGQTVESYPGTNSLFTIKSFGTTVGGTQTYTSGGVIIQISGPFLGVSDNEHPKRRVFLPHRTRRHDLGRRIRSYHSSVRALPPAEVKECDESDSDSEPPLVAPRFRADRVTEYLRGEPARFHPPSSSASSSLPPSAGDVPKPTRR